MILHLFSGSNLSSTYVSELCLICFSFMTGYFCMFVFCKEKYYISILIHGSVFSDVVLCGDSKYSL